MTSSQVPPFASPEGSDPVLLRGTMPTAYFGFGRFRLGQKAQGQWWLTDVLSQQSLELPLAEVHSYQLTGNQKEIFSLGLPAVWTTASLSEAPNSENNNTVFWQFPCRTEQRAFEAHKTYSHAVRDGEDLHIYLGFPWATWIDQQRRLPRLHRAPAIARQELGLLAVELSGLRTCLKDGGLRLKIHTVCQHVYWHDMMDEWNKIGVDHLWLSHCPQRQSPVPKQGAIKIHPWALYAVNIEESNRNVGLVVGRPMANRKIMASFIGANAPHYVDDSRARLVALKNSPGFVVHITGSAWHFEEEVYDKQILAPGGSGSTAVRNDVAEYNQTLGDSRFALCPAGAGPNTLRLWESLAAGCVPVLIGSAPPELPTGGSLPGIDWEKIVFRVTADQVTSLPEILSAVSLRELEERQGLGVAAYASVRAQRCF